MRKFIFTFSNHNLVGFDVEQNKVALIVEAEYESYARNMIHSVEDIGKGYCLSYSYEDNMEDFKTRFGLKEYTLDELLKLKTGDK